MDPAEILVGRDPLENPFGCDDDRVSYSWSTDMLASATQLLNNLNHWSTVYVEGVEARNTAGRTSSYAKHTTMGLGQGKGRARSSCALSW